MAKQNNRQKKPVATNTLQAMGAAVKALGEKVSENKNDIAKVRSENRNVIIGVVLAFAFVVFTVAIELMKFHSGRDADLNNFQKEYYKDMESIKQKQSTIEEKEKRIDALEQQINELKKKNIATEKKGK